MKDRQKMRQVKDYKFRPLYPKKVLETQCKTVVKEQRENMRKHERVQESGERVGKSNDLCSIVSIYFNVGY